MFHSNAFAIILGHKLNKSIIHVSFRTLYQYFNTFGAIIITLLLYLWYNYICMYTYITFINYINQSMMKTQTTESLLND